MSGSPVAAFHASLACGSSVRSPIQGAHLAAVGMPAEANRHKILLLTVGSEPRGLDPDLTNVVPGFSFWLLAHFIAPHGHFVDC
jgi:hypothetical protein